jgi:hypothetical protein
VLLNRPTYISAAQTAGVIFSRGSALEMQRRANRLSAVVAAQNFLAWSNTGAHLSLSPAQLEGICRLGAFDYLVTGADLGIEPAAQLDQLKLYRCREPDP